MFGTSQHFWGFEPLFACNKHHAEELARQAVYSLLSRKESRHQRQASGGVAGDASVAGAAEVEVTALMGAGVDPHAYRQTRSDIAAMTRADLVLWHGLYLEAQMEDFFHSLARKREVVAVAEAMPKDLLRGHDDYADKYDPHVWMSPELWKHVVSEVARALTEARPASADLFAANLARHLGELDRLSEYGRKVVAGVPDSNRVLVTVHVISTPPHTHATDSSPAASCASCATIGARLCCNAACVI